MDNLRPMLARKDGPTPPQGEGWCHEVKWDGFRAIADATDGLTILSRSGRDVSSSWPEFLPAPELFADRGPVLDGELVILGMGGRPDVSKVASRFHVADPKRAHALANESPAIFMAFDLLGLDGADLRGEPLSRRRQRLESLGISDVHWQVPPVYDDGEMLMQATRDQGLEGVVSKRLGSVYRSGDRSSDWLKFPHRPRTSWVIGGWRPETDSQSRLGAVLVGEPTDDGFLYRGRVGSGIAGKVGPVLLSQLEPLHRDTSPFTDEVPRLDALGTQWVEPVLVVDVESLGFSGQGRLRQPSYRGLRSDLTPDDLREQS